MDKGERAEVELDGWGELGAAIAALKDAAWRLSMASFKLEEDGAMPSPSVRRAMEVGACMAVAESLREQVESLATQARKLRKRARDI